jgi:hypothetical protein
MSSIAIRDQGVQMSDEVTVRRVRALPVPYNPRRLDAQRLIRLPRRTTVARRSSASRRRAAPTRTSGRGDPDPEPADADGDAGGRSAVAGRHSVAGGR